MTQACSLPLKKRKLKPSVYKEQATLDQFLPHNVFNHGVEKTTKHRLLDFLVKVLPPPSMIGFNANKNTLRWKDNQVQNSIIATCGNSSSQKIITSFQESRSIVEEAKEEYIPPLWLARYKQLKEFRDIYGHCHVPQRFNTNKSLGKWVHKHRQMARENVTSIKIDRYRALGKIGFWLDPPDRHSISWNRRYVELMKYRNHFGNCNVPQRYAPNPPLGIWVHRQRGELKKMLHGNQTRMTLNRAQALIEIAF